MKTIYVITLLSALTLPAWAQTTPAASAVQPHASSKAALTAGEVKKIDLKAQKVTLKHGEIKNLAMPPMTMVFLAQDPSMLAKLKVGDKLRFRAEEGSAGLLLTYVEKVAP
jgi:Cu/Ag efflux protein CusF